MRVWFRSRNVNILAYQRKARPPAHRLPEGFGIVPIYTLHTTHCCMHTVGNMVAPCLVPVDGTYPSWEPIILKGNDLL